MWIKRPNVFGKVFDTPKMGMPSKVLLFSFSPYVLPILSFFSICLNNVQNSTLSLLTTVRYNRHKICCIAFVAKVYKCFIFCLYRLKYFTQRTHTAGELEKPKENSENINDCIRNQPFGNMWVDNKILPIEHSWKKFPKIYTMDQQKCIRSLPNAKHFIYFVHCRESKSMFWIYNSYKNWCLNELKRNEHLLFVFRIWQNVHFFLPFSHSLSPFLSSRFAEYSLECNKWAKEYYLSI